MKKAAYGIGTIMLLVLIGCVGFGLGRYTAPPVIGTTFYATIKETYDNRLLVKGLDVNDINSRGEFTFSINEKTDLKWRGENISMADLKVGNRISVTYAGAVMETYPGEIKEVIMISLLEDKIGE